MWYFVIPNLGSIKSKTVLPICRVRSVREKLSNIDDRGNYTFTVGANAKRQIWSKIAIRTTR